MRARLISARLSGIASMPSRGCGSGPCHWPALGGDKKKKKTGGWGGFAPLQTRAANAAPADQRFLGLHPLSMPRRQLPAQQEFSEASALPPPREMWELGVPAFECTGATHRLPVSTPFRDIGLTALQRARAICVRKNHQTLRCLAAPRQQLALQAQALSLPCAASSNNGIGSPFQHVQRQFAGFRAGSERSSGDHTVASSNGVCRLPNRRSSMVSGYASRLFGVQKANFNLNASTVDIRATGMVALLCLRTEFHFCSLLAAAGISWWRSVLGAIGLRMLLLWRIDDRFAFQFA